MKIWDMTRNTLTIDSAGNLYFRPLFGEYVYELGTQNWWSVYNTMNIPDFDVEETNMEEIILGA